MACKRGKTRVRCIGYVEGGEAPSKQKKLHLMQKGLNNFIILKCMPIFEKTAMLITITFALLNAKGKGHKKFLRLYRNILGKDFY